MNTDQYSKMFIWTVLLFLLAGCEQLGNYQALPDVDDKINALGQAIAQYQRNEVWTGGNEYSGAYTWIHYDNFQDSGGSAKIAEQARENNVFKEGVIALRQLPTDRQNEILEMWSEPIDRTWAQNGAIGDGTTEAGQLAEGEIAEALTNLVRGMLESTGEEP